MVLVDSSVWIDYFNGVASPETDTLDALLGQDLVLIGDLILTVGAWWVLTDLLGVVGG